MIMEEVLASIPRGTIVVMFDDTTHCHEKWHAVATIGQIKTGRNYQHSAVTAWEALRGLVEAIRDGEEDQRAVP